MNTSGTVQKMHTTLNEVVQYVLPLGDSELPMNELIGSTIRLMFNGQINCIACGRKTSKSFSQGYCFPCMRSLARCDSCIVRPEQCHYYEGTCREPEWGEANCLQPHVVYLANSSGIKVGVTRRSQVPTRWMDQGASQVLPILETGDRLTAGRVEVVIKQHISDRTDWRKMLKGIPEPIDLAAHRDRLLEECRNELENINKDSGEEVYITHLHEKEIGIQYPVTVYPEKVTSLNLDKTPAIEGKLLGIKGQYLIFDKGVLNVRKYGGYHFSVETS